MKRKMFVNVPVRDLKKSMDFFAKLGFAHNPQFSDETAACIVLGDDVYAMLLTHEKFKQFTPLPISDAAKATEVLTCISCESRDEVNRIADAANANGAKTFKPPMDMGVMYFRSFQDLDGHIWEWMWMDPSAVK